MLSPRALRTGLVLLFLSAFSTAATAQTAKAPAMSIQIAVISLDDPISGLGYAQGQKLIPLAIPSGYKPAPVRYNGPAPLVLYRESKDLKGNEVRIPVTEIRTPQNTGAWFAVLKRLPGERESYAVSVIPDDAIHLSLNVWVFINFGQKPLAVDLEKERTIIAPGKSAVFKMADQQEYRNGMIYKQSGTEWKLSYGTRFLHYANKPRTFILLDDPGDADHILLKALNVLPPKPENEKTDGRTTTKPKNTSGTASKPPARPKK
ncbi:MAG: hypothetical protein LBV54_07835 [Puniceicoccales bacterium]|nr:hypothetical protein [Puniceicoccales bacterium]